MTVAEQVATYAMMLVWLESMARRCGNWRVAILCRAELLWLCDNFYVDNDEEQPTTNERGK